jgi:hypothetical protein
MFLVSHAFETVSAPSREEENQKWSNTSLNIAGTELTWNDDFVSCLLFLSLLRFCLLPLFLLSTPYFIFLFFSYFVSDSFLYPSSSSPYSRPKSPSLIVPFAFILFSLFRLFPFLLHLLLHPYCYLFMLLLVFFFSYFSTFSYFFCPHRT